eukprot:TRINITY_DN28816_c0_g1_i1.p1 TRINITY_DN28816_c0_g1~~TRINITY_DN28816_c0_g1_i1.p1  ORF type:complete len:899 (+),score=155.05 TRINITY_DN28816_c0_g1_i1:64-2760(+)
MPTPATQRFSGAGPSKTAAEQSDGGVLLFLPPVGGTDSELTPSDLEPCMSSIVSEVFGASPAVAIPAVRVASLVADVHCVAHNMALEQLRSGAAAVCVTQQTPCVAEDTLPHHFCTVLRRLWLHHKEALWKETTATAAAQRATHSKCEEVHRWTKTLRALEIRESALLGDCVMCAAQCVYTGPLLPPWKQKAVSKWHDSLERHSVPHGTVSFSSFVRPVPCSEGFGSVSADMAAAVYTAEEMSDRWPLVVDRFGDARRWLLRRGYKSVVIDAQCDRGSANARRVIEAAAVSGGRVMIEGACMDDMAYDLRSVLLHPRQRQTPFKCGESTVTAAAGFRVCILVGPPHSAGMQLPQQLASLTSVVRWCPDKESMCRLFLGEVVSAVHPQLEDAHLRTLHGISVAKEAARDAERQLMSRVTSQVQPTTEELAQLRTLRDSRLQALDMLEKMSQAQQLDRGYFHPVAVRMLVLYRVCAEYDTAFEGESRPDSAAEARDIKSGSGWLSPHDFVEVVRKALSKHLARLPSYAADPSSVSVAMRALTSAAIHHSSGQVSTVPSAGIHRLSTLENRLRSPAAATVDACTVAHSMAGAVLSRPGAAGAVLGRACTLLEHGCITEEEWVALLLHHPSKNVDEVLICEQYKSLTTLFDAQRRTLMSVPECVGPDVSLFVEYHQRAEQIAVRLPRFLQEAAELSMLCHWAASPHCAQKLHNPQGLRVYADELRRLAAECISALNSRAVSEASMLSDVLCVLQKQTEGLQREAEKLFCDVAGDIRAQLVYDLEPRLQELTNLQGRAKRLGEYLSILGVGAADFSMLELTDDLLKSVNYDSDAAQPTSADVEDNPATLVPLALPVGSALSAGRSASDGGMMGKVFGAVCGDADSLSEAQRAALFHNEVFYRS